MSRILLVVGVIAALAASSILFYLLYKEKPDVQSTSTTSPVEPSKGGNHSRANATIPTDNSSNGKMEQGDSKNKEALLLRERWQVKLVDLGICEGPNCPKCASGLCDKARGEIMSLFEKYSRKQEELGTEARTFGEKLAQTKLASGEYLDQNQYCLYMNQVVVTKDDSEQLFKIQAQIKSLERERDDSIDSMFKTIPGAEEQNTGNRLNSEEALKKRINELISVIQGTNGKGVLPADSLSTIEFIASKIVQEEKKRNCMIHVDAIPTFSNSFLNYEKKIGELSTEKNGILASVASKIDRETRLLGSLHVYLLSNGHLVIFSPGENQVLDSYVRKIDSLFTERQEELQQIIRKYAG